MSTWEKLAVELREAAEERRLAALRVADAKTAVAYAEDLLRQAEECVKSAKGALYDLAMSAQPVKEKP